MKNKYERLSKEEKKNAKLEYINASLTNKNIYKKVKRLSIFCLIGFIYALIMFVVDFMLTTNVWDYVLDSGLLLFCVLFFFKIRSILNNQINKYLISKDKNKGKK